uniref:C3H1-type domain-containing protein n=1 Tax=Chromera velia CCMP2878 TaxID=1169474 RepID=A0A0G4FM38_9ALVE|eukprot:Cvel_17536.t1-p1 / transcript=Cvel_17536.t1 / gene=Cvel_17536 / organism=Chromera_velia_CCMP2878 / gene_product=RING finger protein unkempt homolog, putative / transcript_product=RING finger protein unkempt homolog, putative / location=Cvel_scaffold1406:37245-45656(-) / protein_length=786 / sequence_SO=supercontig / SO=protein_coding / is_pseudo=false
MGAGGGEDSFVNSLFEKKLAEATKLGKRVEGYGVPQGCSLLFHYCIFSKLVYLARVMGDRLHTDVWERADKELGESFARSIRLSPEEWTQKQSQAHLPLCQGGLGIPFFRFITPAALAGCAAHTLAAVRSRLTEQGFGTPTKADFAEAEERDSEPQEQELQLAPSPSMSMSAPLPADEIEKMVKKEDFRRLCEDGMVLDCVPECLLKDIIGIGLFSSRLVLSMPEDRFEQEAVRDLRSFGWPDTMIGNLRANYRRLVWVKGATSKKGNGTNTKEVTAPQECAEAGSGTKVPQQQQKREVPTTGRGALGGDERERERVLNVSKEQGLSREDLSRFRSFLCCRVHSEAGCRWEDLCKFSHISEEPYRRRPPDRFFYVPQLCPIILSGSARRCRMDRKCSYAHTVEEIRFHPLMYKQMPCEDHKHQNCRRGFCPHAHEPKQGRLLSPEEREQMIRFTAIAQEQGIPLYPESYGSRPMHIGPGSGLPKRRLSSFDLSLFRTEVCRNASSNDGCSMEDRCLQSHISQKSMRRRPPSVGYSPALCAEIVKGWRKGTASSRCPNGAACRYAHTLEEVWYHPELYKQVTCPNFPCAQGLCPFLHVGEERVGPPPQQTPQQHQHQIEHYIHALHSARVPYAFPKYGRFLLNLAGDGSWVEAAGSPGASTVEGPSPSAIDASSSSSSSSSSDKDNKGKGRHRETTGHAGSLPQSGCVVEGVGGDGGEEGRGALMTSESDGGGGISAPSSSSSEAEGGSSSVGSNSPVIPGIGRRPSRQRMSSADEGGMVWNVPTVQ